MDRPPTERGTSPSSASPEPTVTRGRAQRPVETGGTARTTPDRKPLRVLIVEDSEDDAVLMVRELERAGYGVTWRRVDSAATMRTALDQGAWDVVVADYSLPGFSGPGALAVLQEIGRDTPFVVVSGTMGEDVAVAMMRAGAHDYMMKNNLARLAPAIDRELREADVRRERKRAEEALQQSQRLFRSLTENASDLVSITSAAGTLRYVSPSVEHLFGYSPGEMPAGTGTVNIPSNVPARQPLP